MGKDWDDGGRNKDARQCVNSAIFGSHLSFFHCHIIYQNPSLEEAETSSILMARAGVIPRQRCPVKASLEPLGFSLEGRLLVVASLSANDCVCKLIPFLGKAVPAHAGLSTYTHTELVYFTS